MRGDRDGRVLVMAAILTLLGGVVAAASSRSTYAQSTHLASSEAGEHALGPSTIFRLHPIWSYHALALDAIAAGSRVYAIVEGSATVNVVALDAKTGKLLHTFTPASLRLQRVPGDDPTALASAGGTLIVAATREVLAVDAGTGRELWRTPGGATALTVAGNVLYTGKYCQNTCGALASYAISLSNGRVLWKHDGNFSDAPALVAGRLFQNWGGALAETRVYDPATGAFVARLPFGAKWLGYQNAAYAYVPNVPGPGGPPARRAWLAQIGPTGKPVWKIDLGLTGGGDATLDDGAIYCSSNRFHPGVIAVTTSNGHVRWGANLGKDLILGVINHLVFALHRSSGRLDVLGAGGGQTIRQLVTPGYQGQGTAGLLLTGDTVYVFHPNGIVAMSA